MKLLIILDTFPTLSETFLYTLIKNLMDEGINLEIVARKSGGDEQITDFSNQVHYLPSEKYNKLRQSFIMVRKIIYWLIYTPGKLLEFIRNLQHHRRRSESWFRIFYRLAPIYMKDYDIIYLPFGGLAVKFVDLFEISSKPIVFSLRGSDIHISPLVNLDYKNRLKKAIEKAAGIHCVCDEIKTCAEALVGKPLPKASVIYTALAPMFLREATKLKNIIHKKSTVRLVSIGRLDWRKGLEHGLVAARELKERGLSFSWDIFGDGNYLIPIQWAVRDMGLDNYVNLRGPISHDRVINELFSADIFFLPSIIEGISNSALEAMAVGLPIVSTDVGGMREGIPSNEYGYLVPPRDWMKMADALDKLILYPELRSKIGQNASVWVHKQFTIEKQRKEFLTFFNSVIANNHL